MSVPIADESLTLDAAVAYAWAHNPRIASTAARLKEARSRIEQDRSRKLPQAGVNNFVYRQGPVIPGFGGGPPAFPPYRYNVGVFISQVLFDWGQRNHQLAVSKLESGAAEKDVDELRSQVRLSVSATFLSVLRSEELLKVATQRRDAVAEQVRVARARFEADVAPRFDVIRSESELANAEQEIIQARNDVELSQAALNTVLGREVNTPVKLSYRSPADAAPPAYESTRETALKLRPQLGAQDARIKAAERSVNARRAEQRPSISLNAAYDRPNPGGFAPQSFRYNTGLVMSFPFLDGGLVRGRVEEAKAFLERQRADYDELRRAVDLELRQAFLDLDEATRRIVSAEKEVASADEALRVANVRYRAGVGTTVEVTDAQVSLARAGQNRANAAFDRDFALARIQAAVGEVGGTATGAGPARKQGS